MTAEAPTREFTRASIGVVALCFGLNTLARGCGETFAVFYGPLLAEFDWGRGTTASLYSAFMVALGLAGPVIGALFDRYGGRAIYVGGLACYGTGFLLASRMTELWHGWLGLGLLVGIGTAATGMTPATGLISRWFDRNMGFAVSFAYSGFAFGSMLLAPLTGLMIERNGWRWTYSALGWALLGARRDRPSAALAADRPGRARDPRPAVPAARPPRARPGSVLGAVPRLLHDLGRHLCRAGPGGRLSGGGGL